MPYIKQNDRSNFEISNLNPTNAGELNFLISEICAKYIRDKGLRYTNCNEVIGALECAKIELYRRIIAPYEDKKMTENGDISYNKSKG